MGDLQQALLHAAFAGVAIPVGAFLAHIERIQPDWLEADFRHGVIAFGGGVLVSAIALVLVPEGVRRLDGAMMLGAFAAGGIVFFVVDRQIESRGGSLSQPLAMVMDFVPEAMALGAVLATEKATGLLLAGLMALQNLPEGLNAYHEIMAAGHHRSSTVLVAFAGLSLLGPLAAGASSLFLRDLAALLGAIMLFASGGILYLIFQDIARQTRLDRHWAPPLGAVAGFMLGLWGKPCCSDAGFGLLICVKES